MKRGLRVLEHPEATARTDNQQPRSHPCPHRSQEHYRQAVTMHRLKPYGPRGVAMLALAILAFGRAIAYIQPASPAFTPAILIDLGHLIPTVSWGFLWGATGVVVAVGAYRKKQVPALALIAGMSTLWALVYVWAAITRTLDAGPAASVGSWITATVYMALTVIIGAMTAMINVVERVDSDE